MPRKKRSHIKNLSVIIGVALLSISIGVLALYVHLREVDNPITDLHEGETGPEDISEAVWYDNPNGANWTRYYSSFNSNISFELPVGDLELAEVYYPLDGEPKVYVGLFNDVNHIIENDTSRIDNMRTLTYVFEDPAIMSAKEDAILEWNLELLYKESTLNTTVDHIEVRNMSVGEAGIQVIVLRVYDYEHPNNRNIEARYFYSFFEPEGEDYEIFIAYSIVKNLTYDPNQWSERLCNEEAERVFNSFTF